MLLCSHFLSICLCEGNCVIFDRWDTQEASVLTFYNLKDFRVLLCYKRNWFCEKLKEKVLSNLLEPQFWSIFLNTVIVVTPLLLVWCCSVMLPSPPIRTQLLSINLSIWRGKKGSIQVVKSTFYWEMHFKTPRGGGKWAKDIKDHF